jgi:hypothetical protein
MKINILLYLLSSFLVFTFTSCKKDDAKIKVVFPDTVQYEINQYILKYKYMTVVYIDSTACTPCLFSGLAIWKHLKRNLEENNTGVLFIIRNSDEQLIVNSLKMHQLTVPFIFDKGGKFKASNEVFKYVRGNTFVMDENRDAIFNESPIASEKAWNSFIKLIGK